MSIYMEDLVGEDREAYVESATFDNEISKCYALLEMSQIKYEQMCRDAELKVLTEGGTYDDLTYLYQEAQEAQAAEQEGILTRAWKALQQVFTRIKEFLLGKGKELPPDTDIQIDANAAGIIGTIRKALSGDTDAIINAAKSLGVGALALGSGYVVMKKTEAEKLLAQAQEIASNKLFGAIKLCRDKFNDAFGNTNFGKALGRISDFIEDISSGIESKLNEALDLFKRKFGKNKGQQDQGNQDPARITGSEDPRQNTIGKKEDPLGLPGPAEQGQPKTPDVINLPDKKAVQAEANRQRDRQIRQGNLQRAQRHNQNSGNNTRFEFDRTGNKIFYRLDGNRIMRSIGNSNNWTPVPQDQIKNLSSNIRHSFGFESAEDDVIDASEIREALGSNYTVTVSESGEYVDIVFTGDPADDILNVSESDYDDVISTHKSIFGTELENEEVAESYIDDELNELMTLLD